MDKKQEIDKLLKDKPYLIFGNIYEREIDFIKTVLQMKEWEEPRFQGLLTSNIWRSNVENIKTFKYERTTIR